MPVQIDNDAGRALFANAPAAPSARIDGGAFTLTVGGLCLRGLFVLPILTE
jgi:hypothetical protein